MESGWIGFMTVSLHTHVVHASCVMICHAVSCVCDTHISIIQTLDREHLARSLLHRRITITSITRSLSSRPARRARSLVLQLSRLLGCGACLCRKAAAASIVSSRGTGFGRRGRSSPGPRSVHDGCATSRATRVHVPAVPVVARGGRAPGDARLALDAHQLAPRHLDELRHLDRV